MPSQTDWLESLSPWPEEFGLDRMRAMLAELGDPQSAYPAIHLVGTNGKSTATRRAAAFLLREGLSVGAYTSPHVSGWSERIAAEKLAVIAPGATVILGEGEWEELARANGAGRGVEVEDVARTAAECLLGRKLGGDVEAALPGRLEFHGDDVFAGAHNPAGVEWLLRRLPRDDYVICASILADKDARSMLAALVGAGRSFVATRAETERTLEPDELARLAREYFADVESVPDAGRALERARELAGPEGAVLVTGSLYLLRDLFGRLEPVR